MIARSLAEQLRGTLAETVVVENKPGAGGRLAVNDIKASAPDGQTLLVAPGGLLTLYPYTVKQLNYDPVKDLVPISTTNRIEYAWAVGPMVPASVKNLKDYFAWVKANPENDSFATTAPSAPMEFIGLLLGRAVGVPLRSVAYRGSVPAMQETMGGQVAAISSPLPDLTPHLKSGRLRVLATSGATRSPYAPEAGTYAEQGYPQLMVEDWYGIFVRGGTPPAVQQRLSEQVGRALAAKPVVEAFANLGLKPQSATVPVVADLVKADLQRWGRVVKELGIQPE
ncbi:tripartite tricarboxylate transporter substrate-binding protein [Aquabacterium sp. J223]|uniref:tripartite tricarboxylate transporter substrate-binding protein n=1 Tax=Aquabacterium sp. J223 TaxID=2898431 RepID=UPI0021AD9EC9|nr:tripartite tricarboxylate transporter substrate-binding protein [Aquabacterium sp. J223]UUX93998.1 twin-arginine translocation pathway signal protein [Aquabacterium sp. J223]